MGKLIDMTGIRFGKITVVERIPSLNGQTMWRYKCDCGKEKEAKAFYLRKMTNCGCELLTKKTIDHTNKRYGKLVAIEPVEKNKNGSCVWRCKCDCGKESFPTSTTLSRGKAKSCGCLTKEKAKEWNQERRKDLTGQKFGDLTIIKIGESNAKDGQRYWVCLCSCGKTTEKTHTQLKQKSSHCGCKIAKYDLRGRRFGKLTVLKEDPNNQPYKPIKWICQCDCGKIKSIDKLYTTTPEISTRSCGCATKQASR